MTETAIPARAPQRMGLAALALILLVAAVALPAHGFAQDARTGTDVSIGQAEQITDDLYILAGTFEFAGQATGDLLIAAAQAELGGTIGGTVLIAAGETDLTGRIDGSVRVVSGQIRISGTVGGDVLLAGGQLELEPGGRIGGNLILLGGDVNLAGTVIGEVSGLAGDLEIRGQVQDGIDVRTGSLSIRESAQILGPVVYSSRNAATVDPGAQVAQPIQRESLDPWGDGANPLSRASWGLLRTLWGLIAGALLIALAPRLADRLGANAKRTVPSLLAGVVAIIAVPIAASVLMATVVGLPAGLILLVLYVIGLYLTQVVVGLAIGRFVLPNGWNDGSRGFHLLAMAIGVILIGALRFIPLPYVSSVMMLVVTVWGVGAIVMLLDTLRSRGGMAAA